MKNDFFQYVTFLLYSLIFIGIIWGLSFILYKKKGKVKKEDFVIISKYCLFIVVLMGISIVIYWIF